MTNEERALMRKILDLEARLERNRHHIRQLELQVKHVLPDKTEHARYRRTIDRLRARLYAQKQRAELWKHRALRGDNDA